DNPKVVTDVANQLANLFIDENLQTRERQAEGTADFIDSQLADAKKTLDDLEAKVSAYKLQHNGELPQQENSLNGTLSRLQLELQGNQDALNRAQQNKELLQNALSIAEASEASMVHSIEDAKNAPSGSVTTPGGKTLKQSEILQEQYETLSLRYGPRYPD